jgi:rubredoxin
MERQPGEHTWDLHIRYHCCPTCGFIVESREDFKYILGEYQKDLICPRCQHSFTIVKTGQHKLGPLIGEPQPPDMEWDD